MSIHDKKSTVYYATLAFMIPLIAGVAFMMLTSLLTDGYFYLFDDFAQQQVTFMTCMARDLSTGMTTYAHYAELGAGFLETYSYYGIGSPFFWLFYLLGVRDFSHAILWMDALKIAFCGLTSYLYIRKYVSKQSSALIGSMLYALSSYQITNLCFQFADSLVFFPLLLLFFEDCLHGKHHIAFSLVVAIACSTNTVFFYSEVVFIFLYYLVLIMNRSVKIDSSLLYIILYGFIGLMLSGIVFVPSLLSSTSNPRASISFYGIREMLVYPFLNYVELLRSIIFPQEFMTTRATLIHENTVQADLYIPLFGFAFCGAYMFSKNDHITKTLIVSLIAALIPIINSAFMGFTAEYYARWLFMPGLFMIIATVRTYEDTSIPIKKGICLTVLLSALFLIVLAAWPRIFGTSGIIDIYKFRMLCIIWVIGFVFSFIVRKIQQFNHADFFVTAFLFLIIIVTSFFNTYYVKTDYMEQKYFSSTDYYQTQVLLPDEEFCRIDTSNSYINKGYMMHTSSLSSFNSTISSSIFDFYNGIDVPRTVRSNQINRLDALRTVLSCKYVFISDNHHLFTSSNYPDNIEYIQSQGNYHIYANTKYIPMGYLFRHAIKESDFDLIPSDKKDDVLLTCLVLPDNTDISDYPLKYVDHTTAPSISSDAEIAYHQINCSDVFTPTSKGYHCEISSDHPDLLFLSIPYDKHFSVTVNGEIVSPIIADIGFFAVPIDAGDSVIDFTFVQPGLKIGSIMSLAGAASLLITVIAKRKKTVK